MKKQKNLKKITFYGLNFFVNDETFTPYNESEALVDLVLQYRPTSLLDLGTGIGTIAITIASFLPRCVIQATDISKENIEIAKKNANLHNSKNIDFLESDLLDKVTKRHEVIVCNLPFIPSERVPFLNSKSNNEKNYFFDGGQDGFDLYRKLFQQIIQKNLYPTLLIAEIDYTQRNIAISEASKYFPQCKVTVHTDTYKKVQIMTIVF